MLELFKESHVSLPRRYPLALLLESIVKFGVANFEIGSQIVIPFHVTLDRPYRTDLLDPSRESCDETIV